MAAHCIASIRAHSRFGRRARLSPRYTHETPARMVFCTSHARCRDRARPQRDCEVAGMPIALCPVQANGKPRCEEDGWRPFVHKPVGEAAMKAISDRATFASFKHQRGSQRNRSACRGASSTSAQVDRRVPKRCPCSGMAVVRALVEQLDIGFLTMCDEGEDHE